DAEPIPFDQAVEDDFQPCEVCTPHLAESPLPLDRLPEPERVPPASAPPAAPLGGPDVWVVDGFPDFHRAGCPELAGLDEEPVPFAQAVEDGFTPCRTCRPEAVADDSAEPALDLAPAAEPEPVLPAV